MPQNVLNSALQAQQYSQAPAEVRSAIRQASQRTGVDFSYLMAKAAAESSFDTQATASTSSASGLYQFIDQTWLGMIQQHGADYGLADQAAAITRDASGRYSVADAATRQNILDLRFDPEIAAGMAAEFARDNQQYLQNRLGHQVGGTELYLAHFLGAGGAAKFLAAREADPDAAAATLLPAAAGANRNVFYDRATGQPRSLDQVYAFFDAKFEDTGAGAVSQPAMASASGSWSGLGGGYTAASRSIDRSGVNGRISDTLMQRLLSVLSGNSQGLRSVATLAGQNDNGGLGSALFGTDLLLLAQQAI